jgi:hypothetical protein
MEDHKESFTTPPSARKHSRRRGDSNLPSVTERSLLEFLSFDDTGAGKFARFAKDRPKIFGSYGGDADSKALRIQVQNRLDHLRRHPDTLQKALVLQGLRSPLYLANTPIDEVLRTPPTRSQEEESVSASEEKRHQVSSSFVDKYAATKKLSHREPRRNMETFNDGSYEFPLRAEAPWTNAEQIFALKSLDVQVKGSNSELLAVTKITIYIPVYDMRDLQQGRFSATLSPDGSKILLKMPSIPFLFYHDAIKFQAREKDRECSQTVTAHRKVVVKMAADDGKRGIKTVVLCMNDNETVNNSHFNEGKPDELSLKPRVFRAAQAWTHNGQKFKQEFTYITFEMAVDDSDEKLDHMNKKVDDLTEILLSKLDIEDDDDANNEEEVMLDS